ncbi:MAG: glycosyltransferase family 39 protein [Planctomycetota bacterium]
MRRLPWGALLALVLILGAAVRVVAAIRKSLVLDEFHTWFHATRPDLTAFFETLRQDNHPPLGFLTVALARRVLGSSELALRTPALVFGALELGLLAWFGARHFGRARGLAAAALLAVSSLHVDFSSQARMYALHSLAALVTLIAGHALLTRERVRGAQIVLALSLAVAFHTHYFGGHYALGYGVAAVALAAINPALRARLRRFIGPIAGATLISLPWALMGFRAQLEHALPPGGDDRSLAGLAEAFVHLFFLNVRLGGDDLRPAFIGAGLLVLILGALGTLAALRDPRRRTLGTLLATGAFLVPAFAWAVSHAMPRAGFTWHYVLPSAAPLALLAAIGAGEARAARLRQGAFAIAFGLAALLTVLNVRTHGTEDFRGAVAGLLARLQPGDKVLSIEWQPPLFPQGQPYDYYAPRVMSAPPPRMAASNYSLTDPSDLDGATRVLMLRKSLPSGQHVMKLLAEQFEISESEAHGYALDVIVWRRR